HSTLDQRRGQENSRHSVLDGCASRKWVRKGGWFVRLRFCCEIAAHCRSPFRRNARMVLMFDGDGSATNQTANDREARKQEILRALRAGAADVLERMADELVDLPEERSFGQIEYSLRDLAHEMATRAHQAGLDAGKKGATEAPASSARTATPIPASFNTEAKPG